MVDRCENNKLVLRSVRPFLGLSVHILTVSTCGMHTDVALFPPAIYTQV